MYLSSLTDLGGFSIVVRLRLEALALWRFSWKILLSGSRFRLCCHVMRARSRTNGDVLNTCVSWCNSCFLGCLKICLKTAFFGTCSLPSRHPQGLHTIQLWAFQTLDVAG